MHDNSFGGFFSVVRPVIDSVFGTVSPIEDFCICVLSGKVFSSLVFASRWFAFFSAVFCRCFPRTAGGFVLIFEGRVFIAFMLYRDPR